LAKILVIDDDVNLLKMLELMLQRAGHQAILAADGAEGIEMAAKEPPDLAIVDVMMPEMSGHEICRQLRARPATVEIPILILTARSQPADREAALESGATDYMAKPVAPKDLAAKVDELLAPSDAQRTGRVITLVSLRGGVGVSTMSVSLAGALRAQQVPNVTLVDFSPNSGHVALHLRIQPKRSWTQMLGQNKLTAEGIRSLLIRHPSGLNLLAAPISPTYADSLTEKQTATVARVLCDRANFVVIDAPPVLNPMCVGALKAADLVIVVMTADVSSVQSVSSTMRTLVEMGISGRKVHLLLNHTNDLAGLPKAAVERALKRPISFVVPYDAAQFRALAHGAPLALGDLQSPLVDAVQRMATTIKKAA
jgi:pilus assembly protein CpaE